MNTKNFDEAACLAFDLFDGDFGDPDDKVLKDKIVTNLGGPRPCAWCGETAELLTRNRVVVARFEGAIRQYRYCEHCCIAMAKYEKDDGDAIEARSMLKGNP